MKTAFLILSILSVFSVAQAATFTWVGGGNRESWADAANWDNGVPTGNDAQIIINEGGAINGNWNDFRNGSLTVTGNTTISIGNATWMGNLYIGRGATVSAAGDLNGALQIDGTLNLTGAAGYKPGAADVIDLMTYGQINRTGGGWWWPDKSPKVVGILDGDFSLTGSGLQVVTRVLMTGCDGWSIDLVNSLFTDANGSALTKKTDAADISIDNPGNLGNYRVYMDGHVLKVDYVSNTHSVPEPTSATLALLAFSSLFLRRKRVH